MFRRIIVSSVFFLYAALLPAAAKFITPVILCPKVDIPPAIDGKIADAAWNNASRATNFFTLQGNLAGEQTEVYACYDNEHFYLAFKCYDSQMDKIKAKITERDANVWYDDCVEIFLDTDCERRGYLQFISNSLGTQQDINVKKTPDASWNANWRSKGFKGEHYWSVELAMPFRELELDTPQAGKKWAVNFAREQWSLREFSSWSPAGTNGFGETSRFGEMIFTDKAGASFRINQFNEAEVEFTADAKTAGKLNAEVATISGEDSREISHKQIAAEEFGQPVRVPFRFAPSRKGEFVFTIEIRDAATGNILYRSPEFPIKGIFLESRIARLFQEMDSLTADNLVIKADMATGKKPRGYVVYPRAPFEVLTYDALPREEEPGKPMSVFACPGQYEPATFLIYTAKDLQAVEITADRLRDKNNRSIPASNIDIRVMKVWYQGGEGQAFSKTVLVPELLLKNDNLIEIDTANRRNVFNFQGLPADGPDLKPVNIPANSSKQFWLTVKVPDNAVPGIYTSKVQVKPANAPASEIELQLEVLPVKLVETDKIYGLYYYSPSHYFYHSRDDIDGLLKELKDMRAHGMNSASIFAYDTEFKVTDDGQWEINLDPLKTQIQLRIQAGLTGPIIIQFLTHKPPFPVKLFRGPYAKDNAPDPQDVKKLAFIIQTMEEFIRKNNYPQLYYYGVDEPLGQDQIERCAIIFDIIRKAGGKTVTAVYSPFLTGEEKTGKLMDMANYATSTADSLFRNPGSEKYHNLEIHYWHPLENPNVDRLRFGLLTWKAGLDGAYPYAYRHVYQGNPYHDESTGKAAASGERNSMYTYPSETGLIPTIQWEAARAGIDDVRYLTTLRCWVDKSESKKDLPAVKQQREKALLILNNLPQAFNNTPFALYISLTPQDFSNYRKQVADQIIKLQDVLK